MIEIPYFYDKQIRRYLQQFMRMFAGFSVQIGKDDDGNPKYQRVPVRYGDISRMAAHILKNNSDNVANTVPFMSFYITDLTVNPERRLNPTHQDQVQVFERKFNTTTGQYLNEVGNTYTIERHMPVPFDLTIQLDIWTSNLDQKLQLLEQVLVLFNPSANLSTSDNAFDWSRLSAVELINSTYSIRQIPIGTDDQIDVAALSFLCPIFINPPAKVKRQTLIYNIINAFNFNEGKREMVFYQTFVCSNCETGGCCFTLKEEPSEDLEVKVNKSGRTLNEGEYTIVEDQLCLTIPCKDGETIIVKYFKTISDPDLAPQDILFTFSSQQDNYQVLIQNGEAKLLTCDGFPTDENDNPLNWDTLIKPLGELRPGISEIRLRRIDDITDRSQDIIGVVYPHPTDTSKLLFDVDTDTLPATTTDPVNGIIDPTKSAPGIGSLPSATAGDRYIVTQDVPQGPWGNVGAEANDIIEFNGTDWTIDLDAKSAQNGEYVLNSATNILYELSGGEWIHSYEGQYPGKRWRLVI